MMPGITTLWSQWRCVRNVAAEKGVIDFEEDFKAYAACVEGKRTRLQSIMRKRKRDAKISRIPRLTDDRFKELQANYMKLLDERPKPKTKRRKARR